MNEEPVDIVAQLERKAEHHAREADRYRIAADVMRDELRTRVRNRRPRVYGEPADPHRSTMAMAELAVNQSSRPLHPTEMVSEMEKLGWETTAVNVVNTVRTAASRLVEQNRIERVGDGLYCRLRQPSPAAPDESGSDTGPEGEG